MAKPKGSIKTGGRLPGTPNRQTTELIDLIRCKYPTYHPVLALVDIANSSEDISIKLQANKEVAKYVCPQLKSVEVKDNKEEEEQKYLRIVVVRNENEQYDSKA
jgi:hypothetical protein